MIMFLILLQNHIKSAANKTTSTTKFADTLEESDFLVVVDIDDDEVVEDDDVAVDDVAVGREEVEVEEEEVELAV